MALVDVANSPLILDTDTNTYVGILNPNGTTTPIVSGDGLVTSFNGRIGAVFSENSDVTSVVVQDNSMAIVESNIAIGTPGTPQKINFSNVYGTGGLTISGSNDLMLTPGFSGVYEVIFYAATEGFDAGGGFAISTFEAWSVQNSDVVPGSYLISGTPTANLSLTTSKSFFVYLNDSDTLSFYINSSTANLRLNYAAASSPRPDIYPIQVMLKKISL